MATQAAMFLKIKVQQSWGEELGKENIDKNSPDMLAYQTPLSMGDKQFLRDNIFKALDTAQNKVI